MATGWRNINNKTYYFTEEGTTLKGWQTVDGKLYHFCSDGSITKNITMVTIINGEFVKYSIDINGVATRV